MDPRYEKLAETIAGHSLKLKRGEKVLIDAMDIPDEMTIAMIRAVRKRGALVQVLYNHGRVHRELVKHGSKDEFKLLNSIEYARIKKMDAYIAFRAAHNIFESVDVPSAKTQEYIKTSKPTWDWRVRKTRWVVLRWPHPSMAQQSQMSTEAFEDFFFDVCTMDYDRMAAGAKALKKLMDKTDQVRITGPGTDLSFSIKDIPTIICDGEFNLPDGEIFTAPVKNSVEGVISYNTPSVYQGFSYENIRLEFKKGKIVKATANDTKRINKVFNMDKGARYVGEFAIGFNPYIREPMRDILFDEKIAGSFHFTPGQAYETADNGNRSQIHWDIVNIQRPEYGGGEIYFDGKLIRKDGLFTPKSLQKLNPEYLLKES